MDSWKTLMENESADMTVTSTSKLDGTYFARRSSSVNFDSIRTLATGGGPSESAITRVLSYQLKSWLVVVEVILVIYIKLQ